MSDSILKNCRVLLNGLSYENSTHTAGYLALQQHLFACTKHLAGLQLARDKARRLSHLHIFHPKFKINTFEWEIMKNCRKFVFQGNSHPFQGLTPLETADLASSNLKVWLPHFCFVLFNF